MYKKPLRVTKSRSLCNERVGSQRNSVLYKLRSAKTQGLAFSNVSVVVFNALRHQEVTVRQRSSMQHSNTLTMNYTE